MKAFIQYLLVITIAFQGPWAWAQGPLTKEQIYKLVGPNGSYTERSERTNNGQITYHVEIKKCEGAGTGNCKTYSRSFSDATVRETLSSEYIDGKILISGSQDYFPTGTSVQNAETHTEKHKDPIRISFKGAMALPKPGTKLDPDLNSLLDFSPQVHSAFGEAAPLLAQAGVAIHDALQNYKQHQEIVKQLRQKYEEAVARSEAALAAHEAALKESQKYDSIQNGLNLNRLGQVSSLLSSQGLSIEKIEVLKASKRISEDPYSYRLHSLTNDAVFDRAEKYAQAKSQKHIRAMARQSEILLYQTDSDAAKRARDFLGEDISSSGVINIEKLRPELGAGPFDKRTWQTNSNSPVTQQLTRIANQFQAVYAETDGLSTLSEEQVMYYGIGSALLSIADTEASAYESTGLSYIKLAEGFLNLSASFGKGMSNAIVNTVTALPEMASALYSLSEAVAADPQSVLDASVDVLYQTPEFLSGLTVLIAQKYDQLKKGTPEERAELLGEITGELLIQVGTSGIGSGLKAAGLATKAGKAVRIVVEKGTTVGNAIRKGAAKSVDAILKVSAPLANAVPKLRLKSTGQISRFERLSKQVPRANADYDKIVSEIVKASESVVPKSGAKYVKSLPAPDAKFAKAFDGKISKGTYEPGEVLFQAQRSGQTQTGNWFTPVKPINAVHADEMLYLKEYGNDAGQIKAFVVKERVSGYAGKVAKGNGYQFFVPEGTPLDDIFEEVIIK